MQVAARYLDEAVDKANPKSGTLFAWVMLEKAFYEAWFKRDEPAARAAFERVHDWSRVPHHAWLRVSAAMALLEGKPERMPTPGPRGPEYRSIAAGGAPIGRRLAGRTVGQLRGEMLRGA